MLPPLVTGNRKITDMNDCMYGQKSDIQMSASKINNGLIQQQPFYAITKQQSNNNINVRDNGYIGTPNPSSTPSLLLPAYRKEDLGNTNYNISSRKFEEQEESIFSNNNKFNDNFVVDHHNRIHHHFNDNFNQQSVVIPVSLMPYNDIDDMIYSGSKSPEGGSVFCCSSSQVSLSPSGSTVSSSSGSSEGNNSPKSQSTNMSTSGSENLFLLEQFNVKHGEKFSKESSTPHSLSKGESGKKLRSKSNYKHIPHKDKPPHLVARRNARERRRVQAVNGAFTKLRKHIPYPNKNKRLSKVKTLKIAIDYIHHLQDLIDDYDNSIIKQPDTYSVQYKDPGMMAWQDIHQNYHGGFDNYGYCNSTVDYK